jgi:hypothetical protein
MPSVALKAKIVGAGEYLFPKHLSLFLSRQLTAIASRQNERFIDSYSVLQSDSHAGKGADDEV